ncbi:MAG: methyl-accepting chemotaxis protein [Pseudomonadota bacterium]
MTQSRLTALRSQVFVKCAALILLSAVTVAAVLTLLNARTVNSMLEAGLIRKGTAVMHMAADANAAAMRFGNTDTMMTYGNDLIQDRHHLQNLAFYDVDGAVVSVTGTEADPGMAELAMQVVDTGAAARDGFLMAHPVVAADAVIGVAVGRFDAASDFAAASAEKLMAILVAAGVLTVMVTISALLLRAGVTRPLQAVDAVLEDMAVGTYDRDIPGLTRDDEIGSIARKLDELRSKLISAQEAEQARMQDQRAQRAVVEKISASLNSLAAGDLTVQINSDLGADYEMLRQDFNNTVQTMIDIINAVIENSGAISSSAAEISAASDDLSRRTENQAAALEETAASLDQITTAVRDSADGAQRVGSIVSEARETARQSDEVVQDAVNAMSKIEDSSHQISKIISVIDDIAFQTNLLALNAGVEAARAGEAGRGFAVVASEVRALAQRSSDAAKEIKELITQSTSQVEQGVQLVAKTGDELRSIIASVTDISEHITTITSSTVEQSTSLSEVNAGVTQLDQVTQNNAAMVEESTAASTNLRDQAQNLVDRVSVFQLPQDVRHRRTG